MASSKHDTTDDAPIALAPDIDVDAIHKALANPLRRQILAWLREPHTHFSMQAHPLDLGVCAGLLDEKAGLSQSTVSAHLATLQRCGLITSTKVGQWIFYQRCESVIAAFLVHVRDAL